MRHFGYVEFGQYEYHGEADIFVRMSEASARIEARRYYDYMRQKRPDIVLNDDEILEEWMIVNWAGIEED